MAVQARIPTTAPPAQADWTWSTSSTLEGDVAAFLDRHAEHAFQTTSWLNAAIATESPAPRIVTARDRTGRPVAVYPMAVRAVMGARLLAWLGQDWADYCGPVHHPAIEAPAPEETEDLLRTLVGVLGRPIDGICLLNNPNRTVRGDNGLYGSKDAIPSADSGHVAMLEGTWEALSLDRLSAKGRSTQRRKMRRLQETGRIELVDLRSTPQADDLAETMVAWKRHQLHRSGALDHFSDPTGLGMIRATLRPDGEGRIFALMRDGAPLAITHCLDRPHGSKPTRLLYQTSITPEDVSKYSPGNLLLDHILEDSYAKGFAAFDFGMGDESYKMRWANETVRLASFYRATGPRGLGAVTALRARATAKRMVKDNPALLGNIKAMRARLTSAFG